MPAITPIVKDLVLLGGGHSHVILLRMLAMNPVPGLQVTLISPDTKTPYSGMLPGVVAGHYSEEDIHIDLVPLCRFAGARFIRARATNVDPVARRVECEGRPPLEYDVLSINIGITPMLGPLADVIDNVIPVKPIGEFLSRWRNFYARAMQGSIKRVAIVGAGAGGVELCLAIAHRLRNSCDTDIEIHLLSDENSILSTYPAPVQKRFEKKLLESKVQLHKQFSVVRFEENFLFSDTGKKIPVDEIFWVTAAASQDWLAKTDLTVDDEGFICVRDTLQLVDYSDIFAAGDIAHVLPHPRPKAGVYAVRQGPILYQNIRRYLLGAAPRSFVPQQRFLSLISTGAKHAVASRNGFSIEGKWVWHWKNWIDQKFMSRFKDLPAMAVKTNEGLLAGFDSQMQCGGCGSKVSGDLLSKALQNIGIKPAQLDDAAIFEVPDGKLMLHTVDTFKSFVDDPYIFAQISVHHALSDIYAMGGEAATALSIITVPYAKPDKTLALLQQLLAGAKAVLDAEGVELVGGHTTEGSELSIGFAVNGTVTRAELMTKAGMQDGDALILTKALGTGVVFAADMQYRARGDWVESALQSMNQSNYCAMKVFKSANSSSCTDITGFGLAGHLLEMLRISKKSVRLNLNELPILAGAVEVFHGLDIKSTLHEGNQRSAIGVDAADHEVYPLLFDPQTSGGLLATVKPAEVAGVIKKLHAAGYETACCIGQVVDNGKIGITF